MEHIDLILEQYLPSSTTLVDGRNQRRLVSGRGDVSVDLQITTELPQIFRDEILASGRQLDEFRVYGSVGQINFPLAKVPWVAALRRDITNSTTHGYYVVLLFREDMTGSVLSLNQGFTQFQRNFGTDLLAKRKIKEAAALALTYLDVPSEFIKGEIDLGATGDLGSGHERGAIVSKSYPPGAPTPEEFSQDFRLLLGLNDTLFKRLGPSISNVLPPAAEDDFQEAAGALSRKRAKKQEYHEPPPGPISLPEQRKRANGSGYVRDPAVSGAAIARSGYLCALDGSHRSFISRTTEQNFVEAHHLLPMQFQQEFTASLDVVENIAVLMPNLSSNASSWDIK